MLAFISIIKEYLTKILAEHNLNQTYLEKAMKKKNDELNFSK
jgi:hypothetical protein